MLRVTVNQTLSNLVVDYISFRFRFPLTVDLEINEYMRYLTAPAKMRVVEQLLNCIRAHCVAKHGEPVGCRENNTELFMMMFFCLDKLPQHNQFEDATVTRVRDTAHLLMDTLSAIVTKLRWLGSGVTIEMVETELTAPFLSHVTEFFNAYDAYYHIRTFTRIRHSLAALYMARSARIDEDGVPAAWLVAVDDQITRLRERLNMIAGADAVELFHEVMVSRGVIVPDI